MPDFEADDRHMYTAKWQWLLNRSQPIPSITPFWHRGGLKQKTLSAEEHLIPWLPWTSGCWGWTASRRSSASGSEITHSGCYLVAFSDYWWKELRPTAGSNR